MPLKTKHPIKLSGKLNWCWEGGDPAPVLGVDISRGFLRPNSQMVNEIVLAFEDKGYDYNVSLIRTEGARYERQFDGRQGKKVSPVTATCTLYSNGEAGYSLIGNWVEEDDEGGTWEGPWWAEFTAVAHFPDESR